MTAPQSFGDFITRAFEWISERITALFSSLTGSREASAAPATPPAPTPEQERARIREELTQRVADLERSGSVDRALGRSFVGNSLQIVGDLLRGGVTPETRTQLQRDVQERVSQLPAEDQATLREVRRLAAAGGFNEQEMQEVQEQASKRAREARSR